MYILLRQYTFSQPREKPIQPWDTEVCIKRTIYTANHQCLSVCQLPHKVYIIQHMDEKVDVVTQANLP